MEPAHLTQQCTCMTLQRLKKQQFGYHIRHATKETPRVSAAMIAHHWVPVVIEKDQQVVTSTTTPEGNSRIEAAALVTELTLKVTQRLTPQGFHADCGFQAFAWIQAMLTEPNATALSAQQAVSWRHLFASHLLQTRQHENLIHFLHLGGAKHDLEVHGQRADRAAERASLVMDRVAITTIRNVLT